MAKNKRKPSAAQRDKVAIATAKILKQKGVLSKNTKLHAGKFLSARVLKKVQEYQHVAKPSWTAVKVSPAIARQARAEGYQVSNGRVVAPKEHDFIERIKKGMVSGIKPVKGGFMSEVQVPFTGKNTQELIRWIEETDLEGLKLEHEHFAFRMNGSEGSPLGMSYRTFPSIKNAREHLQHYDHNIDTTGFKLYRLHPEDARKFIWSPNERQKYRAATKNERKGPKEKPHGWSKAKARRERLAKTNPEKLDAMRAKERARAAERYKTQKKDPAFMAKAAAREREKYRKGKR